MQTPVLLIIFNRPEITEKTFEAIRQAKPPVLFIAADGPRNEAEKKLTDAARSITEKVDWECDVIRDYMDDNLGCKMRPYSAICNAFEHTEELIILEDDCLPHPDFFSFCEAMLIRYRESGTVMHISGDSFLPFQLDESYYFTRYTHVWGWATYKWAWAKMDLHMHEWPILKKKHWLKQHLTKSYSVEYWTNIFDSVFYCDLKIWDYQWTYSVWRNNGHSIAPAYNLVSNIGVGSSATHTHSENWLVNRPTYCMPPLKHPKEIKYHEFVDLWIGDNIYSIPPVNFFKRMKLKFGI